MDLDDNIDKKEGLKDSNLTYLSIMYTHSQGGKFYCLYRVDPKSFLFDEDTDYIQFIIEKVIIGSEYLTFHLDNDGVLKWCWYDEDIICSEDLKSGFFYPTRDLRMEFPSDEIALLWHKLNY